MRCSLLVFVMLCTGCGPLVGEDWEYTLARPDAAGTDGSADLGDEGDGGPSSPTIDASAPVDGSQQDVATDFHGLVPSNGATFGQLVDNGIARTIGDATFDTSADCSSTSAIGDCVPVSAPADGIDACVCRVTALTVIGTLSVTGSRALAIFAARTLRIDGKIDVSAKADKSGAGASRMYTDLVTSSTMIAAGGSFGVVGGGPGAAFVYGTDSLVPLLGGMDGQSTNDGPTSQGGGGGGALQLSAGEQIELGSAGVLAANGGGGGAGPAANGAGGGSGGGILVEAPAVAVLGSISANGGGGGGGGSNSASGQRASGGPGADGAPGKSPAPGGPGNNGHGCQLFGYTTGGSGGAGSAAVRNAEAGVVGSEISGCTGGWVNTSNGGSGGAVGRIRINTSTQSTCACTGGISPAPSFGIADIR
ncbi:hypothetical protein [Labilithrix luteola]|nr:hypothetical protein [Labilithrix luteola]